MLRPYEGTLMAPPAAPLHAARYNAAREARSEMTQEMRSLYGDMARTAIDGTPMTGEKMAVQRELMMRRDELAPNVGDDAPDFDLPILHGDGERVSLSSLRGQPVALIFGSYT